MIYIRIYPTILLGTSPARLDRSRDVDVCTQGRYSSRRCGWIVGGRKAEDNVDSGGYAFVYCLPTYIQSLDGNESSRQ